MHNITQYKVIHERKGKQWTIVDEKLYLDGLGFWFHATRKTRKQLLESYVETCHLRQEAWIREAEKYARQLLKDEFGG